MFYSCVSQIKNYLLEEPLLDYLNLYGDKEKQVKPTFEECDFSTFIMDMGNKWEDYIVNIIVEKCKSENISYTFVERKTGYHQTKDALNKKFDVIFQAQVKDWTNNIVGYPDIILKKRAFLKLFKTRLLELENITDGEYIVIDIKFSSVKYDEKYYIQETSNYIKFIKGQVSMYSKLLKSTSYVGFIISKDINTLDYPITILVKDKTLLKDCNDAIEWLKLLYQKGKDLDISRLKPNMNNTMDGYWREYKKELLGQINPEKQSSEIKKQDIAYISSISCTKFDLHLPVKQYTVAVMTKLNDKIYFNLNPSFSDEIDTNNISSVVSGTVVSTRNINIQNHIINIEPKRKGTIKSELEITAVYNRGKVSDEIIRGIIQYCLEDCNELEKQYNLI
jgi:hypothetical protein